MGYIKTDKQAWPGLHKTTSSCLHGERSIHTAEVKALPGLFVWTGHYQSANQSINQESID